MKSYGMYIIGRFVLERVSSKPTFSVSRDKGRLIFDLSTNQCYVGSNIEWVSVSPDYATANDLQLQITSNDNDISNLQTDASNLDSRVSDNESDISTLQNDVSDHIGSTDEHPLATNLDPGFVSASDKTILNNIPDPGFALYYQPNNQNEGHLSFNTTPTESYNVNSRISKGDTDYKFVLEPGSYTISYTVYFHKKSSNPDMKAWIYDIGNSNYLSYTHTRSEKGHAFYGDPGLEEESCGFSFPYRTESQSTISLYTDIDGGDGIIRAATLAVQAWTRI